MNSVGTVARHLEVFEQNNLGESVLKIGIYVDSPLLRVAVSVLVACILADYGHRDSGLDACLTLRRERLRERSSPVDFNVVRIL